MANEYATLAECKTRLVNKTASVDDAELDGLREACSRAVDDYLEVPPGYFTPPTAPSVKNLRGSGQSYLNLPMPLYGSVTITANSNITVPNFTVEGLRLRTLNEDDLVNPLIVWYEGQYYAVEGNWGYAAIPAQVREATLQLFTHFYRGRDQALSGVITDMRQDTQFPERDYPRMTRRLLDNLKYTLGDRASGGLVIA